MKTYSAIHQVLKKLFSECCRSLLMLLIRVIPLLVFGTLAIVVLENKGNFPWDKPILLAVHQTAQPQIDVFVETLTKFGVFWKVSPVATVILVALHQYTPLSSTYDHKKGKSIVASMKIKTYLPTI